MTVIIGIDPHKASHTAVAIGRDEQRLAEIRVRATCQQTDEAVGLGRAARSSERGPSNRPEGWATCCPNSWWVQAKMVLDVPATLASRVRVLGTGRSDKNDPNDALSVAIAALRSPGLRSVEPANHREVLRLLAKRNHEIGRLRNIVVSRLHAALVNLSPGGISKELNASDAIQLLNDFDPVTPVEQTRYDLAHELLDDVERLDVQLKASHRRIKTAVKASGTSLTELYGVGPILACELIGYTGDVRRFTTRDQFASYAGVAPVEHSSGGRTVHRLSRRGNRQLNHAIHMVAICQIRQTDSEGRVYFEKKVAEGKTKREAIRSLKRHVSNAVYRQLLIDATEVRVREDKRERLIACVVGSAPWRPALRRSHSRTHQSLGICALEGTSDSSRPEAPEIALLTQRGFVQGQTSRSEVHCVDLRRVQNVLS